MTGLLRGMAAIVGIVTTLAAQSPTNRVPVTDQPVPPKEIEIRGRCVDESGAPLTGCEVFVTALPMASVSMEWPYNSPSLRVMSADTSEQWSLQPTGYSAQHLTEESAPPLPDIQQDRLFLERDQLRQLIDKGQDYTFSKPEAVTDQEGRFVTRYPPGSAGARVWILVLHMPNHYPAEFDLPIQGRGTSIDLGDLMVPRGCRVRGTVRDSHGRPVLSARVQIAGDSLKGLNAFFDSNWVITRTHRDGQFAFPQPIPPGNYQVNVRHAGATLIGPRTLTVGTDPTSITLTAERGHTIEGRIVNGEGTIVPRLPLVALGTNGQELARAIADRNGRFCLRAPPRTPGPVIVYSGLAGRQVSAHEPISWNTKDVVITAPAAPPLRLRLTHRDTGTPITSRVFARWQPTAPSLDALKQSGGIAPTAAGEIELEHVHSGENRIQLRFDGAPPLARTTFLHQVSSSEREPVRIEIAPSTPLSVIVLTEDDQPIEGAQVHVAEASPHGTEFPRWQGPGFLGYGASDGQGHAKVYGASAGQAVDVRAYAQGYTATVCRNFLVGSGARYRVVLKSK